MKKRKFYTIVQKGWEEEVSKVFNGEMYKTKKRAFSSLGEEIVFNGIPNVVVELEVKVSNVEPTAV
jgi:hypothetical protein